MRPRLLSLLILVLLAGGMVTYGYRATLWPVTVAPAATAPAAPGGGGGGGRPPAPVEATAAKLETLTDGIQAIGSLVAAESADVSADSNGRLVAVLAQDGAAVKKGDELFRIDGALLAAELQDAEARYALAEASFRRAQALARSQTVAQSTVDQSRAELDQALAAVELVRERQRRLVIRAPFDGQLGFRLVSEGSYVTAGMPLVRIDQISSLKVTLSIPERFFTAVQQGQEVELTADAVPNKAFRAVISAINPVVDVNGRALQVLATLDNSARELRPGMLARAKVVGAKRDALMVSEAALVPQGDEQVLFVVKANKAERRVVMLGQRGGGTVEIVSGLAAGELVVTAGATRLSPNASVKIANAPASP
jgi:membrane fusion protein, multidrug efflux system